MKGHKTQLQVGDVKLTVARPSLSEMTNLEPVLRLLLEEPEYSEYAGDIDDILAQAVEHETDKDKEALEKLQDVGDRLELWDQWVKFAEVERFLAKRALTKLQRIKSARREMLLGMGATTEQVDEYFQNNLTASLFFMSSSPLITDTPPNKSTTSTTGSLPDLPTPETVDAP